MTAVSKNRWLQAQAAERPFHDSNTFVGNDTDRDFVHYQATYKKYFEYLGLEFDLKGKSVIEIGPARMPTLTYCSGYSPSYIIEPLAWLGSDEWFNPKGIQFIREPAEDAIMPVVDEVWIFNLLQHVMDPVKIIEKSKAAAKTIRFFEPIDTTTDDAHPHILTKQFFVDMFGNDCVKDYVGGHGGQGFHGADCSYGVYESKISL